MAEIEILNKFLVGAQGNDIIIMKSTSRLSKKDALLLAAYLVALADENNFFDEVLKAVRST